MDLSDLNSLAGVAALINSMVMVPSVMALRKIADRHDDKLDRHGRKLEELDDRVDSLVMESRPGPRRRRK